MTNLNKTTIPVVSKCRVCLGAVEMLLDFGLQPVSNRFLNSALDPEFKHRLKIGLCSHCGIMQLVDPFPSEELAPRVDWIMYNEPEAHLDALAAQIEGMISDHSSNSPLTIIVGISSKDDSTLERLQRKGFHTRRLDLAEDLHIFTKGAGVESIQKAFTPVLVRKYVEKYGKAKVVIARHILEHAYDLAAFLGAVRELLSLGGLLIVEVPDCSRQLEQLDYSTIWEEHLMYFTPDTFKHCFTSHGFEIRKLENIPYPMENSLIAFTTAAPGTSSESSGSYSHLYDVAGEIRRVRRFSESFPSVKKSIQAFFTAHRPGIFGAGHTAATLINLLELPVNAVIDDNPHKLGRHMPGSRVRIRPSTALNGLCILGVNPTVEEKIIAKHPGVVFRSLSPVSPYSLLTNLSLMESNPWKRVSPEVFYTAQGTAQGQTALSNSDLQRLKTLAVETPRQRSRLCTHASVDAPVHEMFIVHHRTSYVRPHRHATPESFFVVEGSCILIIFNDDGSIRRTLDMGDYSSEKPFYFKMEQPAYHSLVITSEQLVFYETKAGPFRREEMVFPSWAPEEGKGSDTYLRQLRRKITSGCRLCEHPLSFVTSIGRTPVGDAYLPEKKALQRYPLDLYLCEKCGLLQLKEEISPGDIYREYIYHTADSLGLVEHFRKYAESVLSRISPRSGSLVVELGSNDGSFLQFFKQDGMRVLGIDPALKIAEQATQHGIETWPDFFDAALGKKIKEMHGSASIILANNVLANIDDLSDLIEGIKVLLGPEGVFIFETGYAGDLLQKKIVDNIYHEHLSYFSVKPLYLFFRKYGLELIQVERVQTKGGSIRCTVQLQGGPRAVHHSVQELMEQEEALGVQTLQKARQFAAEVEEIRRNLAGLLHLLKSSGKKIAGYGASVGVTTLLYTLQLDEFIDFLVDDNPTRQNRFSPGLQLPVRSPEAMYDADYTVLLAWQYADPIIRKRQEYLERGGKFIQFLPTMKIVGRDG